MASLDGPAPQLPQTSNTANTNEVSGTTQQNRVDPEKQPALDALQHAMDGDQVWGETARLYESLRQSEANKDPRHLRMLVNDEKPFHVKSNLQKTTGQVDSARQAKRGQQEVRSFDGTIDGIKKHLVEAEQQLVKLNGLDLLPEDQEVLHGIHRHILDESFGENVWRIAKLHDEVTQASYANKLGDYQEQVRQVRSEIKHFASLCPNDAKLSQSDVYLVEREEDGRTEIKAADATETTLAERAKLGKKLTRKYALLRKDIAKTRWFDRGMNVRHFDRLMGRLWHGEVQPRLMAELHEVIKQAENPDQYARDTINRLFLNGTNSRVDGSKVLKGDDYSRLSLNSGFFNWSWGAREGASSFKRAIEGLKSPLEESPKHFFAQDIAEIRQSAYLGEVRFAHIRYLHGVLEQEKNPAAFAISELVRLNDMADSVSDGKPITWRDSEMDFRMTSLSTKEGREEAGERLYARLEPLLELCDPAQLQRVKQLLQTIKDGNGTSSVIKELTDIFVNSINLPNRNPPSQDGGDWKPKPNPSRDDVDNKVVASSQEKRTERAGNEFDEWAKSEAPPMEMLWAVWAQVRDFRPTKLGLFKHGFRHIQDGKTDRQTINMLQEIFREARRAEEHSKELKRKADDGGDNFEMPEAISNRVVQFP